ncbi:MAG: hypothetical protein HFJ60_04700 [Clostridia bacterium]|jgi:hypothetical protein|nr:hypothetical protein [Clostridia bacterium]
MKNTKKYMYLIGLIIFCSIATTVLAIATTDKIEAKLIASKEELEAGEEVVVTLKFDKYNEIIKGINAFKATLQYDEEIFEKVAQSNFTTQNDWEELKYNAETKELVAIKKAGSKKEEDILQLKLKVKNEVEPKKTDIEIIEIVTSEGKEDLFMEPATIHVDIIKEQTTLPEEPDKITSKKYKIENGYIERILPKTTVAEFKQNVTTNQEIVFIDEIGNTLNESDFISTGIKIKVGNTLNYTLVVIGDIDRDTQITINDLAQEKLHLIDYKTLTGIELKAADVDGDGDVTINDIAQMKLILIDLFKLN